jgi:hypothetical protein
LLTTDIEQESPFASVDASPGTPAALVQLAAAVDLTVQALQDLEVILG